MTNDPAFAGTHDGGVARNEERLRHFRMIHSFADVDTEQLSAIGYPMNPPVTPGEILSEKYFEIERRWSAFSIHLVTVFRHSKPRCGVVWLDTPSGSVPPATLPPPRLGVPLPARRLSE